MLGLSLQPSAKALDYRSTVVWRFTWKTREKKIQWAEDGQGCYHSPGRDINAPSDVTKGFNQEKDWLFPILFPNSIKLDTYYCDIGKGCSAEFSGRKVFFFFFFSNLETVPSLWLWAAGATSKHLTAECESSRYVTAAVLIPSSQSDELLHPVCVDRV